jgi:DNA-binding NarL/FixJ family response regulator
MPKHTLLFVDDEPWLTQALRMTLEEHGFHCVVRTDASEAWEYICRNEVSTLITDVMMPPGDKFTTVESCKAGYFLIEKVREKFPRMSIICLSVVSDRAKIQELKRKGVQFIRKGETPLSTARRLVESKATGLYLPREKSSACRG